MGGEIEIADMRPGIDDAFVLEVYTSTRGRELELLGLSGDDASKFVRMQYAAQDRHFTLAFPDARRFLVLVDGEPVGRLIVDRGADSWWIVDLALLTDWRRRGVGTMVVGGLIAEADGAGVSLRCHVAEDNEARRFWARLGFDERGVDAAYVVLERICGTSAR